ncbi:MAG TPA: hypothetical protein VK797_29145, partial [Tepidisphaeraceae bacterium]|nr:hypothetical protein [Tepidisphaeraceae bacterium]
MRISRHIQRLAFAAVCTVAAATTIAVLLSAGAESDEHPQVGYGSMDNLAMLSEAQSRSISPENFTGEKGKAG